MKVIAVDIDGTICSITYGEYEKAGPKRVYIDFINEQYYKGHQIVYWTARGATTGIDWTEFTKKQLDEWGCKYHELKMGKPFYDVLLDDKAKMIEWYFVRNGGIELI